ncbi:MAG: ABC transporter ATP-binding protein [Lachnospiraceae bacterium]|nr:ABC transporter ATP-binding protein [Lachnospiraceae bacterium]
MELTIDRVSKQYGSKIAVDRISLKLHQGVYGLLGANGAGKTTLMRLVCGILKPDSGSIYLEGAGASGEPTGMKRLDVSDEEYRANLGYLPQDFGYYPDFTGTKFLLYMAALKGLDAGQAKEKSGELLNLVGLSEVCKKKIKTYSGGMKQRLGIAQALLGDPGLLILDEPTAGLDPKERVRFRELIGELGKENIVLLSTHIVSDIEHIADTVLMMKEGQLIYQGEWDEKQGDLEAFYLKQFEEE